jgi:hypothetical protein
MFFPANFGRFLRDRYWNSSKNYGTWKQYFQREIHRTGIAILHMFRVTGITREPHRNHIGIAARIYHLHQISLEDIFRKTSLSSLKNTLIITYESRKGPFQSFFLLNYSIEYLKYLNSQVWVREITWKSRKKEHRAKFLLALGLLVHYILCPGT